ncbi:hypothetical protein MSG28_009992 [Choristoneura fumiferana]|uniref:Uncharacterized protein n=1 Tax=Choristoneura fumiferana TaxID=7141 RepID=A0ACC0JDF4_CHOFU|nr:hypothetical protein MSG28_009992 [Choristoneura fumiferana]
MSLKSTKEPKKEIGDELLSFYSDIAELEKTSAPHTAASSPEPPPPPPPPEIVREAILIDREKDSEKEKEKDPKVAKKKSKVKISASVGFKHKTVSSMVAKWQQVADEIHSD